MKKCFLLVLLFISLFMNAQKNNKSYTVLWHAVHEKELARLPKSALKKVGEIYKKAEVENNHPQKIKCLLYQSKFAITLEENAQLKIINNFKTAIQQTTSISENSVLHSVLAHLYWDYFKQHRWKLYNRTQTQYIVTNDFRTWDVERLYSEIHKHFSASLQHKEFLQNTPESAYQELLTATTLKTENTLFDFLAHNALAFYKQDESGITKANEEFKIDSIAYLNKLETYNFKAKDSLSVKYLSLKTYQDLVRFHKEKNHFKAYVQVFLEALNYVEKNNEIEKFKTQKLAFLKRFKKEHTQKEIQPYVDFEMAKMYFDLAKTYHPKNQLEHQFDFEKALTFCNRILQEYPKHILVKSCKKMISEITKQNLQCTLEAYVPLNTNIKALVSYANVTTAAFEIYKIQEQEYNKLQKETDQTKRKALVEQLAKIHSWQFTFPNQKDYQTHKTEIQLPKLPQGRFVFVGKVKGSTTETRYQTFQVTNLVLIEKENKEFQILDRTNGSAITNASINFKNKRERRSNRSIDKDFATDKDGKFVFDPTTYYSNVVAKVTTANDTAFFENIYLYSKHNNSNHFSKKASHKAFVFTDRSIYRPGQEVHFKTIVLEKYKKQTEVVAHKSIEIALYDVNHQEVQKITLDLNEFGTAASVFTLPVSGLNGRYSFKVFLDKKVLPYVASTISVEEYKRPKFEVSFKPVQGVFKLNDSVSVSGFAKALSGSTITDAKVQYRVVRKARYPRWCWWLTPPATAEIAHGVTTTDAKGLFKVVFKALPDTSIAKENQPTFYFTVFADVTDVNGETRTTETEVAVGYHTLNLNIAIEQELLANKKHLVTIDSKNLNGEFVAANGTVKVYKLKAPKRVLRTRVWEVPDVQAFSEQEYAALFPHEPYTNTLEKKQYRAKGELVFEKDFNTHKQKEIALGSIKKWELGAYLIVAEAKDTFGQLVTEESVFTVFNPKAKVVADAKLFEIRTDKERYTSGEMLSLQVGSASKDLTVFLEVEKNHKVVASHSIRLQNNVKTIKIPVTDKDRGGFAVKWHWVNRNAMDSGVVSVSVPYESTDLFVETSTFRDVLTPGAKQKWSFKIKGPKKEKVAAEVLAAMYDASLDQFKPHSWTFHPLQKPMYRTSNRLNSYANFSNVHVPIVSSYRQFYHQTHLPQNKLNWFGFSFNNDRWKNNQYLQSIKNIVVKPYKKKKDYSLDSGTIKIVVLDKDMSLEPLPYVSVYPKNNMHLGTTTNSKGVAFLQVNENELLHVDFVGYKPFAIEVEKGFNSYEVTMEAAEGALDAITLVRGYSRLSKSKIQHTEADAMVQDDVFESSEVVDETIVSEALQGNVTGVVVDEEAVALSEKDVPRINLENVKARTHFNERAFFFPQLKTNAKGEVSFEFTMPEDITTWKMQLLAHDVQLNTALKTFTTVTQKKVMVTPNVPRFLREGDEITLSAKIANLSDKDLVGKARLLLTDAVTGKNIDALLQNDTSNLSFKVSKEGNTSVSWQIVIPENIQAVQYKIVAATETFSDGEQGVLPVLSNRTLVTETLPMWVNGNQQKSFSLNGLKNTNSTTLKNHQLTLEVTSNPAWYAIQALPYLMEYPYECAEQTFARYYANKLASHIVNSNPKIKEVFLQWKNSNALLSNLEKNQNLKSILIEETPWLRDAQSETEQKKRIAMLFDLAKTEANLDVAIQKLENMQFANGGFPWFKGARYANRYITQHIVQGFVHLEHLGIALKHKKISKIVTKAQAYLDAEIVKDYESLLAQALKIKKKSSSKKEGEVLADQYLHKKHLYSTQLQYLYIRSFEKQKPRNKNLSEAIAYYTKQAAKYWKEESLYNKGLLALIHFRNNNLVLAKNIVASLKETSITNEELGMYWKENTAGWYWYQSPIETQSLLIEVFSELENSTVEVDELKKWLLKNKQTQQWKTTKATTEAVYALLLRGTDWLSVSETAGVTIGGKPLSTERMKKGAIEAGTGYFKTTWSPKEISKQMAEVTLSKKGDGMAWGALYWQYFEDFERIKTTHTSLQLVKKVFKKTNTSSGPLLSDVTKDVALAVGDVLTIRMELSTDRDLEFIHLKDLRASGLEPIQVISKYKWQDGLGYYQSTKDASTNFFFDVIKKGVYVFEYDVRVSHKGNFSNGITTLQSMYAPEFSSKSNGIRIDVK